MKKITKAVWANRKITFDPSYESRFAKDLRDRFSPEERIRLYAVYKGQDCEFAEIMRRIILKSLAKSMGNDCFFAAGVGFKHPEAFAIGSHVFIGSGAFLQGRYDGRCVIGDYAWIGPQCYFDARELKIGKYVGIGPGVKVLSSQHSASPHNIPVLKTDQIVERVTIKDWADIGAGTVILKGVVIGKGSIIGANSVVNRDIPDFSIAVGAPAKVIRRRKK